MTADFESIWWPAIRPIHAGTTRQRVNAQVAAAIAEG